LSTLFNWILIWASSIAKQELHCADEDLLTVKDADAWMLFAKQNSRKACNISEYILSIDKKRYSKV
jgi:hypothetical protein